MYPAANAMATMSQRVRASATISAAGAASRAARRHGPLPPRLPIYGDKREGQAAGYGVGLLQCNDHRIAQAKRAAIDIERLAPRIEARPVGAEGAGGDEPLGPGLVEGDEDAEARDAGDTAVELRAQAIGQIGCAVTVQGIALRRLRAPLGRGDVRAHELQRFCIAAPGPTRPEAVGIDQGAVHQQIGIAADRRGEVGVAREAEPKVADVAGAVGRLRLGAQDHQAGDPDISGVFEQGEEPVEGIGTDGAASRQGEPAAAEKFAQRFELRRVGPVVDAVHAGHALGFERAGRGDIRRDHQLLDQAVAVEAAREADVRHRTVVRERDNAFRQVEIERAAALPRYPERAVDAVERGDRSLHRLLPATGAPFYCLLYAVVGEPRGRAHERAFEAPIAHRALRVDLQMCGEAGAVFAGPQRAKTGGERLRQHRHHAVGEIGGVAALPRRLIEGAARPHEMGHVGDGDDRTPAARIIRRGIGLGPDRVVEIAGVRAVDGHQGSARRSDRASRPGAAICSASASASSEKSTGSRGRGWRPD